ncbi:1-phosphofructokinase [Clostridium sp. ZS2-4]|uniref:1-phosphofructokinase n=1 Tax=Clostridium sp. ZS2-4 TaxID=2987703 RepID=UPI00227AF2C0|nr:1-phosphofructokinase [Clostridium sp. ZS2-4]MCY6355530.1 1-phosphofructokinase [Clostridium sp. ZS2-4]
MIITVTLNPAMDKTLSIEDFTLGMVNRVSNLRYDIGGKGINVSKVLKNFNVNSICTGFLGGNLEKTFIEELKARGIDTRFIHIKENTRTNTKIVDTANKVYTDINEAGPEISENELNRFLEEFKNLCNKDDIVVLAGGVSPSVPKDIYAQLITIAKKKGAFVILDADGELLKEGIKGKPDVIKPNNHELVRLLNLESDSEEQLIKAARMLQNEGVSNILISLGEKGSLFVTDEMIYHSKGVKVDVKSTVGAGDSMVAGLVYSKLNNYKSNEALRFATACGAAAVTLDGTKACTLEQVQEMLEKIEVETKEEE